MLEFCEGGRKFEVMSAGFEQEPNVATGAWADQEYYSCSGRIVL